MLISLSLGTLVSIAILNVLFGGHWGGSDLNIIGQELTFAISPLEGALSIIIIVILLGALVGINLMGSGLSDESVKLIIIGVAYTGIWLTFSAMSFSMLLDFPVYGVFIYIVLTIMFVIGVFQKYSGGNN